MSEGTVVLSSLHSGLYWGVHADAFAIEAAGEKSSGWNWPDNLET